MQKEELESLLSLDDRVIEQNEISPNKLSMTDSLIIENSDKISDEVFGVYKKFQPMKQDAPDSMKVVLFNTIKNFALEEGSKGNFVSQLFLFRFLAVKSVLTPKDFLYMAKALYYTDKKTDFKYFTDIYEKKEPNKLIVFIELSDFFKSVGDLKSAIKYYEKFLEIDKTKAVICNITADLYSKAYPYTSIKRQIELYEQSYKLDPKNRLVLHGLAFNYEKSGQINKADEFYNKLLENFPTENDYYNYGGFLIHCGNFEKGHKYFTHRFNIDDINLKYPIDDNGKKRWDLKSDISDKRLLIHYEQGFGDTIMYSRFVPFMKKFTKKITFVVQKEIFELINNSKIFDEIKVISDENKISQNDYEYSMALLDCPCALNINSEDIPYSEGYLTVENNIAQKYSEKYLENTKAIKIGISVSGASDANYNDRNLDIEKLKFLTGNKNLQIYSLQKENNKNIEGIIPLGNTFNDFTDSACAVKNMDLIISTDNVILNLAGALGVKTIGLFNKETNYRWFKTDKNDTGWYKSVKPLQNKLQNDWTETIMELNNIIKNL